MSAERFFDTNILIYAFSSGDARSEKAFALMAEGGVVSVQVLNEFVSVMRRKLGRSWEETEAALGVVRALVRKVIPLSVAVHEKAVKLGRAHMISIYDALILAAALDAGCAEVLSEDLAHGREYEGVPVRNPLR
jgi:predicted nucleic acid-binding protein